MNILQRFYSLPIRFKLLFAIGVSFGLISIFIFIYFPLRLKKEAYATTLNKAQSIARMASFGVSPALFFNDKEGMEEIILGSRQNKDLVYLIIQDRAGRLIASFSRETAERSEFERSKERPFISPKNRVYSVMNPIMFSQSQTPERIGALYLGLSLAEVDLKIRNTKRTSAAISLAVFLFGLILVFGTSSLIIRPLIRMTNTIKVIAEGDLSKRAPVSYKDEVGYLAGEFNLMVDNLDRARNELKKLNRDLQARAEELQRAKEGAEGASLAKSEFLASMSHELRTPLNAVIGFSQILDEQFYGPLNEKQTEYVRDILESGKHLLALINDVLDLAKVEVGRMEPEYTQVAVRELLEHSLIMVKEKCSKHGIKLALRMSDGVKDKQVWADERRLKQVVFNLLSNSAKFTPDGGAITIEAKEDGAGVIINVSDTGIGIEPEHQEKVFEPFYQVKSGTMDKTPGVGLGLSLCKQLVEMHGGRIWVESRGRNEGSRFIFVIPERQTPPAASSESGRELSPAGGSGDLKEGSHEG